MSSPDLIARLRAKREIAAIHPEEPERLTILDTPDPDCIEAADALEAASRPASGVTVPMETTAEERKRALDTLGYFGRNTFHARLLRDIATLEAEVSRLKPFEARVEAGLRGIDVIIDLIDLEARNEHRT